MQWQPQGIPVIYNNIELQIPWTGGFTNPKCEFVDIDSDSDYDIFIGDDQGKLWFFENIGDSFNPVWNFVSDFYDSIDAGMISCPIFCDIDADNDYDLIISEGYYGRVFVYYNTGNNINPIFNNVIDTIPNINVYPSIELCDLDDDNDYDLIDSYNINVRYYENAGNINNYSFELVDTLAQTSAFLRTSFGDLDNDEDFDFVCGVGNGSIWYLCNDGTPSQYNFTIVTQNLVGDVGSDAAPTLVDIDGDGDLDLFVGVGMTSSGGIRFYENIGSPEIYSFQQRTDSYFDIDLGIYSVPRLVDIDADGDKDLFISNPGHLSFYQNIGSNEDPNFIFVEDNFQGIIPSFYGSIDFAYMDADGDYDLLLGWLNWDWSQISYYQNIGDIQNPQFILITNNLLGAIVEQEIRQTVCDIDNDGDYDLFLGEGLGHIYFYRNNGTPSQFHFDLVSTNYCNIDVGYNAAPFFYDINDDGDYDMFIGYNLGTDPSQVGIRYYENTGNPINAIFTYRTQYWSDVTIHSTSSAPCFADIDQDGDADLFIGSYDGGVAFWRNQYYTSVSHQSSPHPYSFSLQPCYPNPFNPVTTINFTLDRMLSVKLSVYNQLGQQVTAILDNQISPGNYQVNWDAAQFSTGVYLILLESPNQKQIQKVILLK